MLKQPAAGAALLLAAVSCQVQAQQDLFPSGRDAVIIGLEDNYYPFSYQTDSGGRTGFDYDFSQALCHRLAVPCEIRTYPFDELIPALLRGDIDIITASLGDTPERRERGVIFTAAYYHDKSIFLIRRPDLVKISPQNVSGLVLASQSGTMQLDTIKRRFANTGAHIVSFDTYQEILEALNQGLVDAAYLDGLSAFEQIKQQDNQDLQLIIDEDLDQSNEQNFARLALRCSDAGALEKINACLDELINSHEYQLISLKYFTFIVY